MGSDHRSHYPVYSLEIVWIGGVSNKSIAYLDSYDQYRTTDKSTAGRLMYG